MNRDKVATTVLELLNDLHQHGYIKQTEQGGFDIKPECLKEMLNTVEVNTNENRRNVRKDPSYIVIFSQVDNKIELTSANYETATQLATEIHKNGYEILGIVSSELYHSKIQEKE